MKKTVNLIISVLLLLALTGCAKTSDIVGKWENILYPEIYCFEDDGTGYITGTDNTVTSEFTYKEIDGEILSITETGDGSETVTEYYYEIEDNQLTIETTFDVNQNKYEYAVFERVDESTEPEVSDQSNADSLDEKDQEEKTENDKQPMDSPDLSEEVLKEKMIGVTGKMYSWAKGFMCDYIDDWNDCFDKDYGTYCAINSEIKSFDDLRNYLSECYSEKTVDEIISNSSLIEKDGKLYTLDLGVGGVAGDGCIEIKATRNKDNTYTVSIGYSNYAECDDSGCKPGDKITRTENYRMIYEDGDWVFDELVDEFGLYITDDVVFSVN